MGATRSNFYRRLVDGYTRAHGGAQGDFLQVHALGRGRLGLPEVSQDRFQVAPDRIGIEIDLADTAMHDAILANGSETEILQIARDAGMTSMFEDGLAKAQAGLTSVAEVVRVLR